MDFQRHGLCLDIIGSNAEAHHAGAAVEGVGLVEDEVANAVVDGMPVIVLDSLQGVGMVAYERVGPRSYQGVGLQALAGHGLQGVLAAPVEADDDDCGGTRLSSESIGSWLTQGFSGR